MEVHWIIAGSMLIIDTVVTELYTKYQFISSRPAAKINIDIYLQILVCRTELLIPLIIML